MLQQSVSWLCSQRIARVVLQCSAAYCLLLQVFPWKYLRGFLETTARIVNDDIGEG
jgi:hypothetical protein